MRLAQADFRVLEDDPFELGVDRLKDMRVAGTVFEGELHLRAQPVASVLSVDPATGRHDVGAADPAGKAPRRGKPLRPGRYRPVPQHCCATDGDPCVLVRQLAGWTQESGWHASGPARFN